MLAQCQIRSVLEPHERQVSSPLHGRSLDCSRDFVSFNVNLSRMTIHGHVSVVVPLSGPEQARFVF